MGLCFRTQLIFYLEFRSSFSSGAEVFDFSLLRRLSGFY